MPETICKSKSAALAALQTLADTMTKGTYKDVLLAISKWIDENVRDVLTPEEKAKMALIFQGTEGEQKGRAWVEREMKDPAYKGGIAVKGDNEGRRYHKMIREPEHGTELQCFWNAHSKTWEPCQPWPSVSHKRKAKDRPRNDPY